MTEKHQETTDISVSVAVRRTGLPHQVVRECVSRRLVVEPLNEADLVELRRIRRLQELGVNLPGIEIILHMRQRIHALQAELSRWQPAWGQSDWVEPGDLWQRRLPWKPKEK